MIALWLQLLILHFESSVFRTAIICTKRTEPTPRISLINLEGETNHDTVSVDVIPTLTVLIPPSKKPAWPWQLLSVQHPQNQK